MSNNTPQDNLDNLFLSELESLIGIVKLNKKMFGGPIDRLAILDYVTRHQSINHYETETSATMSNSKNTPTVIKVIHDKNDWQLVISINDHVVATYSYGLAIRTEEEAKALAKIYVFDAACNRECPVDVISEI